MVLINVSVRVIGYSTPLAKHLFWQRISVCCPCCQEQRSKDYRSGAHGHNLKFVGYRMIQAVVAEIDIEAATFAWGVASQMLVYAVGSGR